MKNKRLFFSLCIVALVGLAVSLIVIGLYTKEKTDWFIVIFAAVLAFTTIWNAIITQGLLNRSTEELRKSKIAFLIDTIERTIHYLDSAGSSDEEATAHYLYRKITLIGEIGDNYQGEFLKDLNFWAAGRQKRKGAIPLRIIKRVEKLREERKT